MNYSIRSVTLIGACGFFLFDRFLKWQALYGWYEPHLLHRWFGWQPFLNPGVAFGIPMPRSMVLLLTIVIISLIIFSLARYLKTTHEESSPLKVMSFALILTGALSNLIDRIVYQ